MVRNTFGSETQSGLAEAGSGWLVRGTTTFVPQLRGTLPGGGFFLHHFSRGRTFIRVFFVTKNIILLFCFEFFDIMQFPITLLMFSFWLQWQF